MTSKRLIIDLLRHGACSDGQIYRGRTDSALSDLGWMQMHAALSAAGEQRWQRICSSPLQRCRLPAQQLAERLGLSLQLDSRLQELDFGRWDGQSQQQIWQQQPSEVLAFWENPQNHPPPAGETMHALQQRVGSQLQQWITQSARAATDTRLLCVTHGGVIRTLLCHLLGLPLAAGRKLSIDYGSLTRIELYLDDQHDCSLLKTPSQVVFINRLPELQQYERAPL